MQRRHASGRVDASHGARGSAPTIPPPYLASPVTDPQTTPDASPATAFVSSRARTRDRGIAMRVFGWLSSVRMAALTIATLAIVIGVATYYERDYGREAAATAIYDATWFNLIFACLTITVFGAAAVRWPWRPHQYGFVIVHLGLLTLIAGFWIARDRLDGMLAAEPGKKAHRIQLSTDRLAVDGGGSATFDPLEHAGIPSFARYCLQLARLAPPVEAGIHRLPEPATLIDDPDGVSVRLLRLVDTGSEELGRVPSADGAPAVKVEVLARPPGGIEASVGATWLDFAETSEHSFDFMRSLPVRVMLGRTASAEALEDFLAPPPVAHPEGELAVYWRGERRRFALTPAALPQTIDVADDLQLVVDLYVLRPRFGDAGLSDDPEAALDPLIRVRVGTGPATARAWANLPVFARMPCYARAILGEGLPTLFFEHAACYAPQPGEQGLYVQGLLGPDDRLRLRWVRASRGLAGTALVDGEWRGAMVGGEGDASPMRLTLATSLLPRAEPGPEAVRMAPENRSRARRWIEVEVAKAGASARTWIGLYGATTVQLPAGPVRLTYAPQQHDLEARNGFAIELTRFVEGMDPGGLGTASYASDVVVLGKDGARDQRHISMNEPMHENGVTLYQSSFDQLRDEAGREIPGAYRASVFTAATDPGRVLKYLGSALLVLGIIVMYWLRGALARRPATASPEKTP